MFCAIAICIEQCKTEGVVNVFQVVRALRVQKPGAVHTVVCLMQNHIATSCNSHHSLIHRSSTRQCMMLFLETFDVYAMSTKN